jgi:hypothetical protein
MTYNYSSILDAEVELSGPIQQTRYGMTYTPDDHLSKLLDQVFRPKPKQLSRRAFLQIIGRLQLLGL